MAQSNNSISPLRQRMIDDMTLRQLQEKHNRLSALGEALHEVLPPLTQHSLSRRPARVSKTPVEQGVSSSTINATIRGLRFFFEITLERPEMLKRMSPVRVPDRLPVC